MKKSKKLSNLCVESKNKISDNSLSYVNEILGECECLADKGFGGTKVIICDEKDNVYSIDTLKVTEDNVPKLYKTTSSYIHDEVVKYLKKEDIKLELVKETLNVKVYNIIWNKDFPLNTDILFSENSTLKDKLNKIIEQYNIKVKADDIIDLFNELIGDPNGYKKDYGEYYDNKGYMYSINNIKLLFYDEENKIFEVDYENIWLKFDKKFGLNYQETIDLLTCLLEEAFKCRATTANSIVLTDCV